MRDSQFLNRRCARRIADERSEMTSPQIHGIAASKNSKWQLGL